jgi:hypothetical protein
MIEISEGDLVTICVLLKNLLEVREKEERATLDSLPASKSLNPSQLLIACIDRNRVEEVRELYDRLYDKVPEDLL